MSSLKYREKQKFEKLLDMSGGYVLYFTNASFETFFDDFGIRIYSPEYECEGSSKARRLRSFWKVADDKVVGEIMHEMIDAHEYYFKKNEKEELASECKEIAIRLCSGSVNTANLKKYIEDNLDMAHIKKHIERIEKNIDSDPALAISESKSLIESCCKTILKQLSIDYGKLNVVNLTKLTMKQLKLLPENIDHKAKGGESVKKILGSLSTIAHGMGELRNLYGDPHGTDGRSGGLTPRHAKLAVTASSALVQFLFETFEYRKTKE